MRAAMSGVLRGTVHCIFAEACGSCVLVRCFRFKIPALVNYRRWCSRVEGGLATFCGRGDLALIWSPDSRRHCCLCTCQCAMVSQVHTPALPSMLPSGALRLLLRYMYRHFISMDIECQWAEKGRNFLIREHAIPRQEFSKS